MVSIECHKRQVRLVGEGDLYKIRSTQSQSSRQTAASLMSLLSIPTSRNPGRFSVSTKARFYNKPQQNRVDSLGIG